MAQKTSKKLQSRRNSQLKNGLIEKKTNVLKHCVHRQIYLQLIENQTKLFTKYIHLSITLSIKSYKMIFQNLFLVKVSFSTF